MRSKVKMKPRIAIPEPCSYDREYSQSAFPAYLRAIEACGGEPVVISLGSSPEQIARQAGECAAVLLPGSKADVDPQKYGVEKHRETAPADQQRDAADELLLQDAYSQRKPIFGICYGLQALNAWRSGTLEQHIESSVPHTAGREVEYAHTVQVESGSRLAALLGKISGAVPVNSSHHQAAERVGDGLRVAARCSDDGVIEALEGTDPEHFVLAVQWHPERGFETDSPSRRLFESFIAKAHEWQRAEKS